MSHNNPGGDPGNGMFDLNGRLVGFSEDGGETVKAPEKYTLDEKKTLAAAVARIGIDKYGEQFRPHINEVLGL